MSYHPVIGISIFIFAVVLSFLFGRKIFKKNKQLSLPRKTLNKKPPPKGEITSPDAPWLKDN